MFAISNKLEVTVTTGNAGRQFGSSSSTLHALIEPERTTATWEYLADLKFERAIEHHVGE